jgi:RimJ/RimL family protein N-acetyltransferase
LTFDQQPQDRVTAWRGMAMIAGHWTLRGFGMFVLQEKTTGAFLGRVGPWMPEGWVGFELGWGLVRSAWGRGYALEAARAAGSWALQNVDTPELVSLIHADNARSQALARRLGMSPARETLHAGATHLVFQIARENWTY